MADGLGWVGFKNFGLGWVGFSKSDPRPTLGWALRVRNVVVIADCSRTTRGDVRHRSSEVARHRQASHSDSPRI
jgi:hypothetical protein